MKNPVGEGTGLISTNERRVRSLPPVSYSRHSPSRSFSPYSRARRAANTVSEPEGTGWKGKKGRRLGSSSLSSPFPTAVPSPTSAHHASLLPFHRYTPATRVKRGRSRSADVESEEGTKCGEEERHRGTT